MKNKKVLSRKEVVEITGIGISTILRLTKKGELPCFRATYPRGRTIYYLEDVEAFMNRQSEKQKALVAENNKG
ncbi:helix-turn-helix transcriptional regulator [Crocinitomix catalasitica]|uniref:helix-turn-helix transcriptional regulator n=1 Tax=Crocinitomix catalasitica TaxID=184607 RepID=UPI000489D97A|nr:helix-turn-helix domain-containing protein [Crocinitomix catalasitica]